MARAPLARLPIVQLLEDQLPTDGVALIIVYPVGILSVTTTPVALLGPLLLAVMVKVTLLPRLGVALSTVLITSRSDCTGAFINTE